MKVMVFGMATEQTESGELASPEEFAEMDAYNQRLLEAGIVLDGGGLQPTSKAKKIVYSADGQPSVFDGPFAETKELIAGYMIWEVSSMEEAIEWVKRSPARSGGVILRKVLDADDFGAELTAEIEAAEAKNRK